MKRQDKHNIDDNLLIRYLAAEVSAEERLQVEQWLAESSKNHGIFTKYQSVFEESSALKLSTPVNADLAWDSFKEKIDAVQPAAKKSQVKMWLSIAACILFFFSIGIWLYLKAPGPHDFSGVNATIGSGIKIDTTLAAIDQPLTDTLPDGSFITLNKNSSLTYQSNQYAGKRSVTLKGEAFFNVKHDANRPFSVKVNDVLISVLGTSFNIRSIGNETEIIVEAGVVGISSGSKSIKMYKGEKLLVTRGNNNWKKEPGGAFNLNKYPGLLNAILKNPNKWPGLLKNYIPNNDTTSVSSKNKAVVHNIINELILEKIVPGGVVRSFRLNNNEFIINDNRQPDAVHQKFKAKYIKEANYTIYYGGSPRNGKGIFVNPDSL